jgi:uncharacterized protein (DUF952 family)
MLIYHITTKQAWEAAHAKGYYEAPSLHTEGFIHCSKAEQVGGVLERYYSGQKELLKLTIDPGKLTSSLKFEMAPSVNEEFPHVYGTINLEAVVKVDEV